MARRSLLQRLWPFAAALPVPPDRARREGAPGSDTAGAGVRRMNRPDEFWRDKVSPQAYAVLFNEATERAGSSPLNAEKRPGRFICAACHLPLFESEHKFESGTGWPSFTQAIAGHTGSMRDFKLIFPRTEYHCARCGGHQGHIFDDGPPPLGKRWCNNGLALAFVPQGESLPPLRG